MPRFLALDWSPHQLLVVSATIKRGVVQIERTAAWAEEQSPGPEQAEALGKLFSERLKSAGIAPAPVLACLGRDRVILKDIRHPAVSPEEEPAIVRFQVVKELTSSPDDTVIDYLPRGSNSETGERKALVVIVQRSLVYAYRTLCHAAGLKLAVLMPRPWGTVACWRQAIKAGLVPDPGDAAEALLTVTDHWGEFCVAQGSELLFTRPMTATADKESGLLGEIRRNLAVHASQSPQHPVRGLCVATGGEPNSLQQRLQDSLAVGVHAMNPLAEVRTTDVPPGVRGGFAGAVGLLYALAEQRVLPINLAQPKEPRPPRDPNKRRLILAAVAVGLVLLTFVGWGVSELFQRDSTLEMLALQKSELDTQLTQLEEDAKRLDALGAWVDSETVWLDELYDLTDRFPDPATMRLMSFAAQPVQHTAKDKDKDKHTSRLTLKGVMTERHSTLEPFVSRLLQEQYYDVPRSPSLQPNGRANGVDRQIFKQQFETHIDIAKRPASGYVRRLPDRPKNPDRDGDGADGEADFGDQR